MKTKSTISIKGIVVVFIFFWLIAFFSSMILKAIIPNQTAQLIYPGLNVFSYGLGPTLATIVMYLFTTNSQTRFLIYPFLGTGQKFKAILFYLIPIIGFMIFSEGNYLKAFLISTSILLYCLFEEIGWRGFVLSYLRFFNFYARTIVTYVMWLLWHFSFQAVTLEFAAILFVGNFFINLSTRKSQSILVAATMHALINIIEYSPKALLVCIPVWAYLFYLWDKENLQNSEFKKLSFWDKL
jgi:uncharacterized protein